MPWLALIGYQSTKTKNFTAITEIKPIRSLELNKYLTLNKLNKFTDTDTDTDTDSKFQKITKSNLLNLYLEILNDKSIFEDAFRKFNFLDVSQYSDEQKYNEEIIKLASSVKILLPLVDAKRGKKNLETSYHTISFTHHDAEKWKSVLTHVDEFANKLVKKTLIEEFNNTLIFLKYERKYKLEDISIEIDNLLLYYEREISDQLAYLKEQSEIAKKLGIAKNTIEVQTFGNQNALLSNVQTDSPFYLRGYEAINKEIELIRSRKDKKAFTKGLFNLEKKKRTIEQDQTIERAKLALQSNLQDNSNFSAASINAITTKFEYKNYKNIYLAAIVIGLMVGVFYVIISNAFQSQRVSRKKTN